MLSDQRIYKRGAPAPQLQYAFTANTVAGVSPWTHPSPYPNEKGWKQMPLKERKPDVAAKNFVGTGK